jgi:ketosteroid isomerase-like protein
MDPTVLLDRLQNAVNAHDLDGIVACFALDYRNETPAHPMRGFVGRDQVRTNWARILSCMPDVVATVHGRAVAGDVIWSEWEIAGTRLDGVAQAMRGVMILGVESDQFAWCRFYLEPVDAGDGGVDAAVGRLLSREGGDDRRSS